MKEEKKFYIMAQGSCKMRIFDGEHWFEETLQGPSEAIEFKADLWREFYDFSDKAVMFTLCNDIYDDFTIRLKFKAVKGNSGLYFRGGKNKYLTPPLNPVSVFIDCPVFV